MAVIRELNLNSPLGIPENIRGPWRLIDLSDFPESYVGAGGFCLFVKITEDGVEFKQISISLKRTKLTLTGQNSSGFIYNITASGTNYVFSGDSTTIGADITAFNNNAIQIQWNGLPLIKGIEVVWISSVSFQLNYTVDADDELIILT